MSGLPGQREAGDGRFHGTKPTSGASDRKDAALGTRERALSMWFSTDPKGKLSNKRR